MSSNWIFGGLLGFLVAIFNFRFGSGQNSKALGLPQVLWKLQPIRKICRELSKTMISTPTIQVGNLLINFYVGYHFFYNFLKKNLAFYTKLNSFIVDGRDILVQIMNVVTVCN